VTLVLQSRAGLRTGDAPDNPLAEEQGRKVLEVLAKLPGEKSAGFEKLVRQMNVAVEEADVK
jgi:hypothetical protein